MNELSIREQILRAIAVALGGDGSPAAAVFRSRLDQIRSDGDESALPCFDISPGKERDDPDAADHDAWGRLLSVDVRAIVDGTGHEYGDGALDPMYLFAVRSMMCDETFGGLAISTEWTGTDEPVFLPEGRDIIGLTINFDVKFAVKRGDPAEKG
ncbi:hypothetical protein [Terriglobus sp. ADX1]|uniref:hypothetical protein n=1 Tax=Terriglobus sp. ADX1 TaxID=2794063 RepID=UPI002FE66FBA